MPRPAPATDPWAAMAARGWISPAKASQLRNGHACISDTLVRVLADHGYAIRIDTTTGRRVAICDDWPEKA